ncbi:hypothetical protein [Myxococcus xanthus]|nr:hypothetical protein [Myxococcus xanthus]
MITVLGRLGWSLRRIEDATRVRRETASGYLKAAGVGIRPPHRWGKSKPANDETTEASATSEPEAKAAGAKPAQEGTTDSMPRSRAGVRHVSASIVAPYVELVRQRMEVGRNGRAIYEEHVDPAMLLKHPRGPKPKKKKGYAPGNEVRRQVATSRVLAAGTVDYVKHDV